MNPIKMGTKSFGPRIGSCLFAQDMARDLARCGLPLGRAAAAFDEAPRRLGADILEDAAGVAEDPLRGILTLFNQLSSCWLRCFG